MVKVLIKKLDPKVKLPIYKTEGSSGMDLMAFTDNPIKIPSTGLSGEGKPTGQSFPTHTHQPLQLRSGAPLH